PRRGRSATERHRRRPVLRRRPGQRRTRLHDDRKGSAGGREPRQYRRTGRRSHPAVGAAMFLANSRYAKVATVETKTSTGETAVALKLRRLAPVSGDAQTVQSGDRLDLIAQTVVNDAT